MLHPVPAHKICVHRTGRGKGRVKIVEHEMPFAVGLIRTAVAQASLVTSVFAQKPSIISQSMRLSISISEARCS